MEYIVRPECLKDMLHAGAAADAGDHYLRLHLRELAGHHETDVVLRGFRLIQKHHFGGLETGHLTHHFQADGTGGTGNEHPLAHQLFFHRLQVHANL